MIWLRSLIKIAAAAIVCLAGNEVLAQAQGHPNGNRLALDFSRADTVGQQALRADRLNKTHTFRYLKVTEIEKDDDDQPRRIVLSAIEPSSDMIVKMIVTMRNSLQIAKTLDIGDPISVDGRVADLGTALENQMLLQPVRINFKDRDSPKMSPELLREVDTRAH